MSNISFESKCIELLTHKDIPVIIANFAKYGSVKSAEVLQQYVFDQTQGKRLT